MRASSKVVLIGLLIFSAVSCAANTTSESASSSTTSSPSTPNSPSTTATGLNATLVGGGDVDIQVALQQSPVALWFWAPG